MRIVTNIVLGSFLAAVAALLGGSGAFGADSGTMIPAGELVFGPIAPGSPVQVAELWGDRTQGEHGMLLKIPAGFEAGLHSHTGDYHAINLQGTWVHTLADGQTKELPPGSYVAQPGMQDHNDVCKGPSDCILFIHQQVKGDFIPAKTQ
jgi:quercetin dioxygenase-like cupin family protein